MSWSSALGSSAFGSLFSSMNSFNRSTHRSGWGYAIDPVGGVLGKALIEDDKYQDKRSLNMASALASMNYQYAIRGMLEGPSASKQGLIAAGYNPMLAIGGTVPNASISVGNQSPKDSPHSSPIDIASAASALASANQARAMVKIADKSADADIALKRAEASKIRRESDSIAPSARKAHDYISAGKDAASPILQAAATAYGAKKGVEIATTAMKKVGIKNARQVAKASVKAAVVNSAKSAAGAAAKTASPLVGYYGGKYGEEVNVRRYDHQRGKSWSTIFSKRPLTH